MPTVYRVLPDPDEFQSVLADDVKAIMKFPFDGMEIGEAWHPPAIYSPYPMKPIGDFWGCFSRGAFAIDKEDMQLDGKLRPLVTFLDQSCEVLRLPIEDRTLLLCNVTYVLNCLDDQNSRHKPGIPHWFDEYVFHPHRFEYSLFKIPQTRKSEILCVEGIAGPEDEFKGTVEMLGLTGLRFQQLWSDEPST